MMYFPFDKKSPLSHPSKENKFLISEFSSVSLNQKETKKSDLIVFRVNLFIAHHKHNHYS